MDARIAGQLAGVVHTIPTRAPTSAAVKPGSNADTAAAPAQLFDANGDGAIESWSYAHGGDSYTTFRPPPSGAVGSNLRHVNHGLPSSQPVMSHSTRRADTSASTTAAIHHAHAAYERDGAAAAPDTRPPSAPASTVASGSSAPAPQVTQPNAAPPLPSNRS